MIVDLFLKALGATCHNLKTPFADADGNVMTSTPESEFPEQMPYTEWENSIFADTGSNPASCQDCHMPTTTAEVSNRPMWLAGKEGFAKHHLAGANTVMLTMLRDNAAQLGVTSQDMNLGVDRARAMLQSAATVEIVSASVVNDSLQAHVKVTNESGHKAPTAYPSRRMWLHFKVTDSNGAVVFESGRMNADGSIEGCDNDLDQTVFEPHYDLITSADQVQIYETIMGDTDNDVTYTLLRAAQYLKDNRLTPKGFDKNDYNLPDDVAVHGFAADDEHDSNFNLGSDEVTYRIDISDAPRGNLDISVTLNYQPLAHGFVQDLYRDSQLSEVQDFAALYAAQSLKHEPVADAQTTVVNGDGGTPPAPAVNLSATPSNINRGESAELSWSATNASWCETTDAWAGRVLATSGTEIVSPDTTTLYGITCFGDGRSGSDSVTVTVNMPPPVPGPTVSLTSSPSSVRRGNSIALSWSSTNADSCRALGDWSDSKPVKGSESLAINDPVTFTLSCSGDGGEASSSVSYRARGRRWLDLR